MVFLDRTINGKQKVDTVAFVAKGKRSGRRRQKGVLLPGNGPACLTCALHCADIAQPDRSRVVTVNSGTIWIYIHRTWAWLREQVGCGFSAHRGGQPVSSIDLFDSFPLLWSTSFINMTEQAPELICKGEYSTPYSIDSVDSLKFDFGIDHWWSTSLS